jgi:DNA mismatch endonuclease, patch repair protein
MADTISAEIRSKIMSQIRSKNTKPEIIFKKTLKGSYIRYQPKVYGKPDFANKKRKIAIFIDGCFWHKCPECFKPPKSNKKYWIPKIQRNVQRDKQITRELKERGWKVYRFWEHEIMKNPDRCARKIRNGLH